jgi:hypothetical protein
MIVNLTFPIPDFEQKKIYAAMLPDNLHCCLDGKDPLNTQAPVISVGAILNDRPIGIALASDYTKIQTSQIHAIAMDQEHANENLASKLLETISNRLINDGVTSAFAILSESPITPMLEKVYLENQWQGPRPFMIECRFKRNDFDPDWWNQKIELPEGFEEFLFINLTSQEKKNLLHQIEQMNIPFFLNPLEREKNLIEYKNSLGLRYKGKVIGWMVTHRISPDIIRYSALYLDSHFSHTGYWLRLLIDALQIHKKSLDAPYGYLEINVEQVTSRWLSFVKKNLFPHAYQIIHKQMFWKQLDEK